MLKEFQKHINNSFSFLADKKLLVAVSGGVDSVVLTCLFRQNYNISLVHCNFKLRGEESDLDEVFVRDLAEKLDVNIFVKSFDTMAYAEQNKKSIQIAARELRYDWFNKVLEEQNFDYVLTGHHADDSLETFLINLSRGTGLEGLKGIPKKNNKIVRPLLSFSRETIEKYAFKNNISWREDVSNQETKYLRNKIRHNIVPQLKELNPKFLENFLKTTSYLNDSQKIIEDFIGDVSKGVKSEIDGIVQFDVDKILNLSNPKAYLYQFLKSYGITEWDDVFDLLSAQSGKKILTKSHILLKNRRFLLISQIKEVSEKSEVFYINEDEFEIEIPINLRVDKEDSGDLIANKSIKIDKKSVTFPLILRKMKVGDFFYPTKMQGKKKLSKYFKDKKISQFDKEKVWLLCSNDDIVWVIGMRQDRRFLPKNNKETLTISIL